MNEVNSFLYSYIRIFIYYINILFYKKFRYKISSFHSFTSLCNNFLLQFILSYLRYVLDSLYQVLEAGEKLDTGDENSLIFGMGK